jgi:hypothetical protein
MRAKTHLHTPLTRALVKGVKGVKGYGGSMGAMGACWQCRHKKPAIAQTLALISELSLAQLASRTWRP